MEQQILEKRLSRVEVPQEQTWDLSDLFPSKQAWETEVVNVEKGLLEFTPFQGHVCDDAASLLACLTKREQLTLKLIKVSTYATLRQSEDGTDSENQANSARISALLAKANETISFINSELLQLSNEIFENYIKDEPELVPFKQSVMDLLETKPHRLCAETEKVLAALGDVHQAPYAIYQTSKSADMVFASFKDENGKLLTNSFALFEDRYEFSNDPTIRYHAYQTFTQTLQQYKNTFAAVYATEVKKQVALSKLRGYESVIDMLLEPQKVTRQMYENQLDVIFQELAPHMRRYAKLKKQVLGLNVLRFCDLKAPLDANFQPTTTFEEASQLILEALKVMGPEYCEIMKQALTNRWVDYADNIGKSTGAFCSSPYGSHPYILITWTDTMRGAFVLAHELGHAGHFFLANHHQRVMGTRPSMYFIEAPSTMNEMLLGEYLLSQTNDTNMKRWVILQLLGTYYHNFVTHLLEAEFQRRVYRLAEEGTPLTAKVLCEQTYSILHEFWGDTVQLDEGAGLTWMRQPHYYMGLYPYTYSAGLTASTAVAKKIKEKGNVVVERWLEVLRAGGTMTPLELMQHAGVDMSTTAPIKEAVQYVGHLIDDLEASYQ